MSPIVRSRWCAVSAFAVLAFAGLGVTPPPVRSEQPPAAPAAPAPAAPGTEKAAAPADGTLDLHALRGKVVLLDFWASWCVPCAKSFPWLSSLQIRHRDEGLVVIGVDVDKDRAAADEFLARHRPAFRVAFDPKGELAAAYDLQGMPCSFLLGRDGTRRFDHVGFRDSDTAKIEQEIRTLLAEEEGTEP